MSIELIAVSSFIIALLGGIAHFVKKSNLKHLKICGCCQSDCTDQDKNELKKIESNLAKINKLNDKINKLKMKRSNSEPTTANLEPIGDLHIPIHEQIHAIYKRMHEGSKGNVVFLTGEENEIML
jgi:hypothetical protein